MDVSLKTLLRVSTLRAKRPERLATLKKPYFIAYYDGPPSRGETWETLKRQCYTKKFLAKQCTDRSKVCNG